MNSLCKKTPFVFEAFLIILSAILVGTLLIWFAYLLPTSQMEKNMPETASIFLEEGTTPNVPSWAFSVLNNFTEGLYISEAIYDAPLGALHESMAVSRNLYGDGASDKSLINHYINGFDGHWSETYSRYWHGYLVFLKPLLILTNYGGIRIINASIQLLLIALASVLLFRSNRKQYLTSFLLSLLTLRLIAVGKCITYSHVFYISLIACIIIIISNNSSERTHLRLFLLVGILTAYFDTLTYPIVTFFLPAIMLLNFKENLTVRNYLSLFLKIGCCWLAGYAFMWIGKWIVGSIITGENYFREGIAQIIEDTGNDIDFSYCNVLYATVRDYSLTPATIAVVVYAFYLVVLLLREKALTILSKQQLIQIFLEYLLIAGFPFFYFKVMLRHTGIHHGLFANKVLIITTFALLSMFIKLISECRRQA